MTMDFVAHKKSCTLTNELSRYGDYNLIVDGTVHTLYDINVGIISDGRYVLPHTLISQAIQGGALPPETIGEINKMHQDYFI